MRLAQQILITFLMSLMLTFGGSVAAQAEGWQNQKGRERPIEKEKDKPKDEKRDEKRDEKKKPY